MGVSVVVTCWNGRQLIENNLPQILLATKNPLNQISEIILVDDASSDDSVDYLTNHFPQVKIVCHQNNLGYSTVCNDGVTAAKEDFVVILNLDVLPKTDFLIASLPHFTDPTVFAVSFNEGKYGPGLCRWQNGFIEIIPQKTSTKTALASWASGGSAIFRKNYWQQLGGMDQLFLPFYCEDIDLGIRAEKAGYQCLWEPKSVVEHRHESTINRENFKKYHRRTDVALIKERNHLLLTWRNIDSISRFTEHLLQYLFPRLIKHPGYTKIVISALIKFATNKKTTR